MLSLLAYLLLTAGVCALACGAAVLPFLYCCGPFRSCWCPFSVPGVSSVCSDVPDLFWRHCCCYKLPYFCLHSSVHDVPGVSSAAVDPAIADVLAAAASPNSLCCGWWRPSVVDVPCVLVLSTFYSPPAVFSVLLMFASLPLPASLLLLTSLLACCCNRFCCRWSPCCSAAVAVVLTYSNIFKTIGLSDFHCLTANFFKC